MFLLEIKVVSYGGLTIGGIIAMTLGSVMLIDSPDPYLQISLKVILPAVAGTAMFFVWLVGMGFRAQRVRPVSGSEGMLDQSGVVSASPPGEGSPAQVRVHGEIWQADSHDPLEIGDKVRVVSVDGLRLRVEKEGV